MSRLRGAAQAPNHPCRYTFVLCLVRSSALNSVTGSPGYWGEPSSVGRPGPCGKPRAGPGWRGWRERSREPRLAPAYVALEGAIAPRMGVRDPVLLAQQIIAGKLDGTGFKPVGQDPESQETVPW